MATYEAQGGAMSRTALDLAQDLCSALTPTDPTIRWHDLGSLWSKKAESKRAGIDILRAAMPDLQLTFLPAYESGDQATGHVHAIGTHTGEPLFDQPAAGKAIEADAMIVIRIEGDRIVEAWEIWNGLPIYRALGLLREGTPTTHPAEHTPGWDKEDEAAYDSFPASDPPSHY
jgi:SnoaL-like polyketide cyclase